MPSTTVELSISGMTCASCVGHVTKALQKVSGVQSVAVNLATEHALVTRDLAVDDILLIAAVKSAGYGATLVLSDTTQATEDDDALRRERELMHKRRLLILSFICFVPTAIIAMLTPSFIGKDWLLLALTLPVWGIVGWDFHRGAIAQIRHRSANMDTLISIGSTAALGLSIYTTLIAQPTYYETASAIITFIFLGKYLEAAAKGRSNQSIRALLSLRPATARRVEKDGSIHDIPIAHVVIDDLIQIPAGESIPVDGVVQNGNSAVNVAMLTGEPLPVEVGPGSTVKAGTVNGDGTLIVRATAVGMGTALAKIIEIVRRAQGSNPPIQRLADRVAGVFVPTILCIAIITFAAWIITGASWSHALVIAVAVLVVACPCALGLATPTAIMVGVGVGAQRGLLFKDASTLERLGKTDTVIFDKTGTLTNGRPEVSGVYTVPPVPREVLLAIAAAVEQTSSHPLAAAIIRVSLDEKVPVYHASESLVERGSGMRAIVKEHEALVGTKAFLESKGIICNETQIQNTAGRNNSTRVYVAHKNVFLGFIELADHVRPQSHEAIKQLQKLHIQVHMVSGDLPGAVEAVAHQLGITQWAAQATPEYKSDIIRALHAKQHKVAFIGDGINDAPALASADVGLAMGGGTEIAMETAQVAILSNNPEAVADAIRLSRSTTRTIIQNLFWAFAYNVVLIPLAALGLVQPMMAAGAMGLSSLFVVGNSLLLRRR